MIHTPHIRSGRVPAAGGRSSGRSCTGQDRLQGLRRGTALLALCLVVLALLAIPGPVAASPDLQVTFVQANIGGATAGTVFTYSTNPVRAAVKNNGPDASPAAVLRLTSSDGFSGTGSIPELASGSSTYVTITDTTLRHASGTTVSYTATADPDNLVNETSETNNAYTRSSLPVTFNGYKSKALYSDNGGNVTTKYTYDLHGGIVHSFGDSYYRSGSFSGGWTDYDVTWNSTQPLVPANATVREVRLYLPYTWDYPNETRGYDMPGNVTVTFNGNTITRQDWYWDRGNFGEWGLYTYGLMTYDVTSLYQKNTTNVLHFTRSGVMDKLSLYGMTLLVVYDDPAASRKQIFVNEEFDLLGADYANYKTTEAEAVAYVPFTGMTIDTAKARTATLMTFVPSGDSNEGNLYKNGNLIASSVWNYGAAGQPVGENGYPQVAVDERDVLADLTATGNVFTIQSTAWASQPCMAASQQFLVVDYYDAPVAGFAADTVTGSAPLTVQFTDQSTHDPAGWAWDFDNNGVVDNTTQSPAYTYTTAGNYTVKLTATNPAGSDDEVKTGYITVTSAPAVLPLPGYINAPTDPDSDGLYEDLNGNNRKDYNDLQLFYSNLVWIAANEPVSLFDFNHNTRIDFNDLQVLYTEMV